MSFSFIAALLAAPPTLTLIFGGDVMLNGIPPSPKTFAGIAATLHSGDLAMANLEVPLTDCRVATTRKSPAEVKKKDQWILKASPAHVPFLQVAGLGAVSLGNNHAMDYGQAGLNEMRRALSKAGIVHAGAGDNSSDANRLGVICLRDGTRVGMLSVLAFMTPGALRKTTPATLTSAGVAVLSFGGRIDDRAKSKLAAWVANARRKCDCVIIAAHWGTERKPLPNPYQVTLGRALIDAGADVVWGNHPHVLQGAEFYRGRPILYSMGNLISALPATTGFARLRHRGQRWTLEFFPANVSRGQVSVVPAKASAPARSAYQALCQAIQSKYPNPNSCAPIVSAPQR
ncbi:CapA family protein [Fimbriimonas ginsengisoli]|uniref:Capsule biosynthesis protein capA n=1 Tax=Fimbriimonas ginsengisoli Gsoil 348 TaxID=661478 RepID=A0A068NY48_FIMGI|nr:CapA family protein [Fimbriimonas ginsengisoli]AIE87840.1 Capsule biosynthesis protein capA [Fimbriimonas ginsengisoli Gsoil 348]